MPRIIELERKASDGAPAGVHEAFVGGGPAGVVVGSSPGAKKLREFFFGVKGSGLEGGGLESGTANRKAMAGRAVGGSIDRVEEEQVGGRAARVEVVNSRRLCSQRTGLVEMKKDVFCQEGRSLQCLMWSWSCE